VQDRIRSLAKVERIESPRSRRGIRFGFPPAPRSGDIVARTEGLDKAYGETVVFRGLDLVLRRGERVALVGPNGAGKSTLLKLLDGELAPDAGELRMGENVSAQRYAQHHLESLDPSWSVLEAMEQVAGTGERQRLRGMLGRFLFSGKDIDKVVGVLSGGEKARLALARMLLRTSNLLLLDEPTNHLDLPSREVLEAALDEYAGTLVVISHDRYFINRIATCIAKVGDETVKLHPGDYETYIERQALREEAPAPDRPAARGPSADSLRRRDARRSEAEARNVRYRERRAVEERLAPVESEIAEFETRQKELTHAQTDPAIYSDPNRSREIARELTDLEARLETLYARWESLTE